MPRLLLAALLDEVVRRIGPERGSGYEPAPEFGATPPPTFNDLPPEILELILSMFMTPSDVVVPLNTRFRNALHEVHKRKIQELLAMQKSPGFDVVPWKTIVETCSLQELLVLATVFGTRPEQPQTVLHLDTSNSVFVSRVKQLKRLGRPDSNYAALIMQPRLQKSGTDRHRLVGYNLLLLMTGKSDQPIPTWEDALDVDRPLKVTSWTMGLPGKGQDTEPAKLILQGKTSFDERIFNASLHTDTYTGLSFGWKPNDNIHHLWQLLTVSLFDDDGTTAVYVRLANDNMSTTITLRVEIPDKAVYAGELHIATDNPYHQVWLTQGAEKTFRNAGTLLEFLGRANDGGHTHVSVVLT